MLCNDTRLLMQNNTQACCRPALELAPAVPQQGSNAPAAVQLVGAVNGEAGCAFILLMVQLEIL
jgi:hypothetical protein